MQSRGCMHNSFIKSLLLCLFPYAPLLICLFPYAGRVNRFQWRHWFYQTEQWWQLMHSRSRWGDALQKWITHKITQRWMHSRSRWGDALQKRITHKITQGWMLSRSRWGDVFQKCTTHRIEGRWMLSRGRLGRISFRALDGDMATIIYFEKQARQRQNETLAAVTQQQYVERGGAWVCVCVSTGFCCMMQQGLSERMVYVRQCGSPLMNLGSVLMWQCSSPLMHLGSSLMWQCCSPLMNLGSVPGRALPT